MKFGVYIRSLREKLGWTQPEAAEKIEIEQSYLSKLETGKCFPSEDIFSRLSSVYRIDAHKMIEIIDSNELEKLKEVNDVRKIVVENRRYHTMGLRRWLITGLVFLMLSGACISASTLSGSEQQFHYRSWGVLQEGEGLDAFDIINRSSERLKKREPDLFKQQQKMINRIDQLDIILSTQRGEQYIEEVDGGKRVFKIDSGPVVEVYKGLKWLIVPGMMFFAGSFGCFFISYRWR